MCAVNVTVIFLLRNWNKDEFKNAESSLDSRVINARANSFAVRAIDKCSYVWR